MIKVYFEIDNWYCKLVAYFDDEETYMVSSPALEVLAASKGMFVTESMQEYELDEVDELTKEKYDYQFYNSSISLFIF